MGKYFLFIAGFCLFVSDLQFLIYNSQQKCGNQFSCVKCNKSYMSQAKLTRHLKYECGTDPKFVCAFCPHRTKHNFNLKKHILLKHPDQLPLDQ